MRRARWSSEATNDGKRRLESGKPMLGLSRQRRWQVRDADGHCGTGECAEGRSARGCNGGWVGVGDGVTCSEERRGAGWQASKDEASARKPRRERRMQWSANRWRESELRCMDSPVGPEVRFVLRSLPTVPGHSNPCDPFSPAIWSQYPRGESCRLVAGLLVSAGTSFLPHCARPVVSQQAISCL